MNRPGSHRGAPSPSGPSGFPGFGEDAPLDLSGLTRTAEQGLIRRLRDGSFDAWADTAARVGYCSNPVRLAGSSMTVDARTGEVLDSFTSKSAPLGVVYRACGNRRAEVCPSCSRVYARDTFAMIRAGLQGGKTVPDRVSDNPLLFATATAPSFGPVHGARPKAGQRSGGRCRPRSNVKVCSHSRPTSCMKAHMDDDPANGLPLCGDCYDWHSAVIWQWWAPELWRRTTIALRRALATRLGVPEKQLKSVASLQYAKVGEFQHRGLIHFHALIRLDGPDGPGSPAPLDGQALAEILRTVAPSVRFTAPPVDGQDHERVLAWGRQLDVRVVRDGHRTDDPTGPVTPDQVAGYLAKYATKDANSLRGPGEPRPQLMRMAATCRDLAARARRHDRDGSPYLLLGKWAHMLGFRGHFSTKSRRYSITLGALRRARQRFQRLAAQSRRTNEPIDLRDLEHRLLTDEEETTLVIGEWAYQGTGWTRGGDQALALAAAARAREYAQWRAEQTRKGRTFKNGLR